MHWPEEWESQRRMGLFSLCPLCHPLLNFSCLLNFYSYSICVFKFFFPKEAIVFVFLTSLINFGVFLYSSEITLLFPPKWLLITTLTLHYFTVWAQTSPLWPLDIRLLLEQLCSADVLSPYSRWMVDGENAHRLSVATREFTALHVPLMLSSWGVLFSDPGEAGTWLLDSGVSRCTSGSICSISSHSFSTLCCCAELLIRSLVKVKT